MRHHERLLSGVWDDSRCTTSYLFHHANARERHVLSPCLLATPGRTMCDALSQQAACTVARRFTVVRKGLDYATPTSSPRRQKME